MGAVIAHDGTRLNFRHWQPSRVRGTLVIAHGLGEHGGRYEALAQFLSGHGADVWALDHRGHGESAGARGVIPRHNDFIADLDTFIKHVNAQTGQSPILLGHSLGGLIAASYATRALGNLKGLVLSSPALKIYVNAAQAIFARILNQVAPHVTLPNGLKQAGLSHDAAVAQSYAHDPLVHNKISGRLITWMLAEGPRCIDLAPTLHIPTLVMWAGNDMLVNPAGSERFTSRAPSALCKSLPYPGLFHEIFNEAEPDRARVWNDLLAWLNPHLSS